MGKILFFSKKKASPMKESLCINEPYKLIFEIKNRVKLYRRVLVSKGEEEKFSPTNWHISLSSQRGWKLTMLYSENHAHWCSYFL